MGFIVYKYIEVDFGFVCKVAATFIPFVIAVIQLQKDFRAKTKAVNKEGFAIAIIMSMLAPIAIYNIFNDAYTAGESKATSNLQYKSIRQDAVVLSQEISGSDELPVFSIEPNHGLHFKDIGSFTFMGYLSSNSKIPVRNIQGFIVDIDKINSCVLKLEDPLVTDRNCLVQITSSIDLIPLMLAGERKELILPINLNLTNLPDVTRLLCVLQYKGLNYEQQLIMKKVGLAYLTAVRVRAFDGQKVIRTFFLRNDPAFNGTDWDKEFPVTNWQSFLAHNIDPKAIP